MQSRRLSSSMMKNKGVGTDTPFLPQEIIRDILKRLPVKSLIQFQCVCRHWRDLFKDPSFIADHLHHSNRQHPYILFQKGSPPDNHFKLYTLDSDMQVRRFENPPLVEHLNRGKIVGSSNGLLCVQINRLHFSPHSFLVWNPAIKEVKLVPETHFCRDSDSYGSCSIGFGFCPSLNDCKIVITYVMKDCFEMFKVYSLRSGSWKEVQHRLDVRCINFHVTVNGVMYWWGIMRTRTDHGEKLECLYFSFDLATEVWTVLPIPPRHPSLVHHNVMVYEGKLAYVSVTKESRHYVTHIWVMEEGLGASGETWNWAKKFSSKPYPSRKFFPQTMWGNEIFCTTWDSKSANTMLINPTTGKFKKLNIPQCDYDDEHKILNYVESLVPIGKTESFTEFLEHRASLREVWTLTSLQ